MAFFSKAAATVAGLAAGAALADKVGSIVSQTQQAFNKVKFGDVSGAASAAGFKPITKFKINDLENNPSTFAVESTKSSLAGEDSFKSFIYPSDIGKYFIKFSFQSYQRLVPLVSATDLPKCVVVLPIPTNLTDNFSVSYNDAKLGAVTGALVETGVRILQGNQNLVSKETGSTVAAAAGVAAREQISRIGGEALTNNIDKAVGAVPNPHLAAIFQDIGLREHNFTFRFSPKNANESRTLKNIIKNIKIRILPGASGGSGATGPLFTFPDTVDVSFGPKEEIPYKFQRCVVTSFNVNYSPNGTPSFFKDGSPTDIEMSISLKEVRVFTREDFLSQKDEPSSATQTKFNDVL